MKKGKTQFTRFAVYGQLIKKNSKIKLAPHFVLVEWSHVMVLGGYITNGGAINEIEVLNMKTLQQCSHPFQLPERRFGAAAFLLNGRLNYALGQGYTKPTDTLQFDLRSRTWRTFDLETYPVVYSASAQIRDAWVLLISGHNVSAITIVHANGTTVPGPPLPHGISRHCAIGVDEDHIFVAGGVKDGIGRTKDTFVLKWSEQVWVPQDPLTLFHRSVTCETFLDGDNRLNILVGERYFEIFTWSTRKWRHGPDMLEDYMWGKLVRFDGKLYLFGGKDSLDERNAKIHVFDPIFETWTRVPLNLKTGRTSFGLLKIPPGLVDC